MEKYIFRFWHKKLGIDLIDSKIDYIDASMKNVFKILSEQQQYIQNLETEIEKLKIENDCYKQIFSSIVHFEKKL